MNLLIENNKFCIVTLVKAVGIILMVLAHSMPPEHIVWKIIYCFHMPLFFIMSGYCFKEKYLFDAKKFILQKLKGIYLPMVLFSLPILFLHNLLCKINIYDPMWLYSWEDYVWNVLRIITRMSHNEGMLGTFWFLKDLFFGNLIFYFVYKLIRVICENRITKKYYLYIMLFTLIFISELCSIFHFRIPYFGINEYSINAAIFITIGHMWKSNDWNTNNWIIWIIGVLAIVLKIYFISETVFGNTNSRTFLGFAIPAIFATMMTWNLCSWIHLYFPKVLKACLEQIGKCTLWIMALHFLAFKLLSYIYILINELPTSNLVDFPILKICSNMPFMWLIYTFVGIILPMFCSYVFLFIKNIFQKCYYGKCLY